MTRTTLRALTPCAALLLAAACSSGGETPQSNQLSPSTGAPTATARPSATTGSPTPTTTASVHVYYLRGEHLLSVHRSVPVTSGAVATATMRSLLAGPTAAERSAGMTTTIPAATTLRGIAIRNGTAAVDLSQAYESGGGSLSMSARLAQVTYTMTQFPTVQRVTFEIEGTPVTVFSGEGIVLDHPATRSQFYELLPPIWIDSPAVGQTVTSPVVVRGLANVFEGQFSVDVVAGGKVLATRPAHAAMGEFAPFTVSVPYAVATSGPGQVVGWDASAKDGSRIDVWPITVTLR